MLSVEFPSGHDAMKQARFGCSKELRRVLKGQEELVLEVIFHFLFVAVKNSDEI